MPLLCTLTCSPLVHSSVEYSDVIDVINSLQIHQPPRVCVSTLCAWTFVYDKVCTIVAINCQTGRGGLSSPWIRRWLFCRFLQCNVWLSCQTKNADIYCNIYIRTSIELRFQFFSFLSNIFENIWLFLYTLYRFQ